jgi:hypothetical protein
MRYRVMVVLCLVGFLIASAPAFAQRTTGDIVGTVSDESGAVVPGVTVTLTGEFAAGTFTSITSAKGVYRFSRLHPGSYDLSFTMDGFSPQTRTGLRVPLGATTEENVTLSLGGLTDEVTVTADSVVVDATDVGLSNTYNTTAVENLPTRRRSIYDLMQAAPSVTSAVEGGDEAGHYLMGAGGTTDGNAFQLDGVSVNSRSQGRVWLSPNPDIIEEVEILTLGAPAEYGHAPGAVFNVVTKQGSNTFHGSVNYFHRSDGMTGRNTTDDYDGGFGPSVKQFRDATANLSGPIVKDKLWFFVAYQDHLNKSAGVGVEPQFHGNMRNKTYFAKLNWQINPNHKVQFGFNNELYSWGEPGGAYSSPSLMIDMHGNKPTPSASYTGLLTDTTMLEVRYGGFYGDTHFNPADPDQDKYGPLYYNVHGGQCSQGPCLYTGNPSFWYDFLETSTSVNVSLSHYADDFLGGSHDFKFGVQYLRAGREDAIIGYTDLFYLYEDDYGNDYLAVTDYTPFSYGGLAHNKAVFFDDTFRVNDRLTLKIGARYDMDRASVPELPWVDQFGQPTGASVPEVSNLFSFNTFSPRLGFTYKLTEDGKTLLRGHWGKYSRGLVTMDFAGGPGNIGSTDLAIYTSSGEYPVDCFYTETCDGDGRGTFVSGAANNVIDPDISATYTSQYVLGFERALTPDVGLSLTYMHKRGNNHPAWTDDGTYETFQYTEPETGVTLDLSRLTSDPEARTFSLGNPDFMDSRAHAFIVAMNKRMSGHWQATSSVQFLRSTGKLASQYTQNGWGRMDGGVAWRDFGKFPNNFVNLGGRTIGDRPVTFKTQLLVELPVGFMAGANYTYTIGPPWAREARVDSGPGVGREWVNLEEKDGSRRAGNRSVLDFRFQKTFDLGEKASLLLAVDAYNVFNNGAGECVRSANVASDRFGDPDCIVDPRRLQLGAKFHF